MTKPQKRRDVETKLKDNGCTPRSGSNGPHEKWDCPCGKHIAPLPRHSEITPGVVSSLIKQLPCLPKGWLT